MTDENKTHIFAKFKRNGTKVDPVRDIDLQHLPLSKFDSPKVGKEHAIKKVSEVTGLTLTERDFNQTLYNNDMMTGKKNEPVEWVCKKDGKYREARGLWKATMSMDDPPPKSNGPDRPHIGYRVDFINEAGRSERIQTGHIYVPSVPASRMDTKVRDAFKNRR
jgi:hypothetical protein